MGRVGEPGPRELITEEAMKRGEITTIARPHSFLSRGREGSTLNPRALEVFSGVGRSSRKPGVPDTRKPRPKSRRPSKKVRREGRRRERGAHSSCCDKPLKGLAFDAARLGLISWHRRRYCPKGFRPPYAVRRAYEWTYLYAAPDPTTG